jgi:hypothetical protein
MPLINEFKIASRGRGRAHALGTAARGSGIADNCANDCGGRWLKLKLSTHYVRVGCSAFWCTNRCALAPSWTVQLAVPQAHVLPETLQVATREQTHEVNYKRQASKCCHDSSKYAVRSIAQAKVDSQDPVELPQSLYRWRALQLGCRLVYSSGRRSKQ